MAVPPRLVTPPCSPEGDSGIVLWRSLAEQDTDVEASNLGQAVKWHGVGFVGALEGVGVGDDELFGGAGWDRKDPGGKLVAGLLLKEGRILVAVQEILVDPLCPSTP